MRRLTLFLAVPVGLAVGVLAWLGAGGASAGLDRVAQAETLVAALPRPSRPTGNSTTTATAELVSTPLFALTTGPGAVQEPSLRLEGLSVTRRRAAALLAIADQPAEWLSLGETRDGVTLQRVLGSKVIVETVLGERELMLGSTTAGRGDPAAPVPVAGSDGIPPGFRSPPPPASAPSP